MKVPKKPQDFKYAYDVHRWISAFLTDRKQSVVVDGERSEEADVLSGVLQVTLLDPLLFLLHINDLPDMGTQTPVADFLPTTAFCTASWTALTTSCSSNKI